MERKIRVLVIDDSAFMRRIIRQMLESHHDIEVVGTARDGMEGVEMALELEPDVITMDIEMPRMNGLDATQMIMEKSPRPIIMLSSLTTEGAKATFDALDRGAVDYVSKNLVSSALDVMKVEKELVDKIRAVAGRRLFITQPRETRPEEVRLSMTRSFTHSIGMVIIGASTGGPKALQMILPHIPRNVQTSFLVVIHMPGAFTGAFAERLDSLCQLHVKEAENGEKVSPGKILVSPGGVQTMLKKRRGFEVYVEIGNGDPGILYKPSIDISMTTAAMCYLGRSMGVILTGMGSDGKEGMRVIKEKGGRTIAQDEATSTVFGMPKAVIEAGLADKVVPLEKMALEIINML